MTHSVLFAYHRNLYIIYCVTAILVNCSLISAIILLLMYESNTSAKMINLILFGMVLLCLWYLFTTFYLSRQILKMRSFGFKFRIAVGIIQCILTVSLAILVIYSICDRSNLLKYINVDIFNIGVLGATIICIVSFFFIPIVSAAPDKPETTGLNSDSTMNYDIIF